MRETVFGECGGVLLGIEATGGAPVLGVAAVPVRAVPAEVAAMKRPSPRSARVASVRPLASRRTAAKRRRRCSSAVISPAPSTMRSHIQPRWAVAAAGSFLVHWREARATLTPAPGRGATEIFAPVSRASSRAAVRSTGTALEAICRLRIPREARVGGMKVLEVTSIGVRGGFTASAKAGAVQRRPIFSQIAHRDPGNFMGLTTSFKPRPGDGIFAREIDETLEGATVLQMKTRALCDFGFGGAGRLGFGGAFSTGFCGPHAVLRHGSDGRGGRGAAWCGRRR